MIIKKFLPLALVVSTTCSITAQNSNEIIAQDVKTVEFRKTSADFGMPICTLGESLTLSFDIINDSYSSLEYKIRHCDANFEPDDLDFYEFADGFDQRTIDQINNSFNTHTVFTHYNLDIPNNDIQLKISGNYIITVYDPSSPDDVVLRKKFMIAEPETKLIVNASAERPFLAEYSINCQQVKVNINNSRERMSNAARYLAVYAAQNGDINHSHKLEYDFTDTYNIRYNKNDGESIFNGGGEFLYFDAKDINFKALGIDEIEYIGNRYRYLLSVYYPSESAYRYREDLNGQYYIKNDRGFNRDLESDYVEVVFRLKYPPLANGEMYVLGAFNNYACDQNSQMTYNYTNNLYQCSILLKQGLYNYTFVIKYPDGTFEYPDGSWYNTENNYLITIYDTNFAQRGNRLLYYTIINSMQN